MSFDLYHKRNKLLPDLFTYDSIPEKFKNQIVHIVHDFYNKKALQDDRLAEKAFDAILNILLKELGKRDLYKSSSNFDSEFQVEQFFLFYNSDYEINLSIIELWFYYMEVCRKIMDDRFLDLSDSVKEAVDELNYRFKENGVGYQYVDEKIIRINDQLLHQESIIPAIHFLNQSGFENAHEEFMRAHEHYRFNRNPECLNDCLKSFETTMKIICDLNQWQYDDKKDTAKTLIKILLDNKFIPLYNENQLNALNLLMTNSIPTIRNKNSGHGQGSKKVVVNENLVTYMLFMTGSTIRFLAETQSSRN
jgi:hypothetical protein